MIYLIYTLLIAPNLYFAITLGAWYSWACVGFIAGLMTSKLIIDIIDRRYA